ncbi:hypothetical protein WME73_13195 [Sorangium sp. So ce302]|uniref:hypothetical protein n=1 Tax=unclassified Sorangium TaxID=2621164 RepID=UPI003F61684E
MIAVIEASLGEALVPQLDAAARRALGSPQNARASRLLFLASDGSTRFYRDCDALLSRYPRRLLACRLEIPGEALGEKLTGSARMIRNVLVLDKRVATRALLAVLPPG